MYMDNSVNIIKSNNILELSDVLYKNIQKNLKNMNNFDKYYYNKLTPSIIYRRIINTINKYII